MILVVCNVGSLFVVGVVDYMSTRIMYVGVIACIVCIFGASIFCCSFVASRWILAPWVVGFWSFLSLLLYCQLDDPLGAKWRPHFFVRVIFVIIHGSDVFVL